MKTLGKINFKIKGGCLSLLCMAGAFKLGVDAFVKLDGWVKKERDHKQIAEACEAVRTIDRIVDKLEAAEKTKEEVETEES